MKCEKNNRSFIRVHAFNGTLKFGLNSASFFGIWLARNKSGKIAVQDDWSTGVFSVPFGIFRVSSYAFDCFPWSHKNALAQHKT